MERLYYESQYIKEFKTEIIEKIIEDNKVKVVLNKTIFFPGGGGQSKDTGYINDIKVLDVYEEEDKIIHVLEHDINERSVFCKLDWINRRDGMEQHLGQHILSGSFYKLLGRNTVSIHLGKDISTVDIIGELGEEDISKVNYFANNIIEENRKVTGYFPENKELNNMNLRRDLPITEKEIRVLQIEGLDLTACCGVHLGSTLEIKLIKIKKFEKNKNNTRIYFLAGNRAVKDSIVREKILKDIEKDLSTNGIETISAIKNLKNEIDKLKKDRKNLEDELLNYEIEDILTKTNKYNDIDFAFKVFKNKDNNFIRNLSNKIIKENNKIVVLVNERKGGSNIILVASKNIKEINLLEITKKYMHIINGKGGGSNNRVEVLGESKDIYKFIDNIEKEIKK